MVERTSELDVVFRALGDRTRRDMLKRLGKRSMSVGEIAVHYQLTFAAIAKHVDVLARAGLVTKTRQGKERVVDIAPRALASATKYLDGYRQLWEDRLNSLDVYLKTIHK